MKLWAANIGIQSVSYYFRVIETANDKIHRVDCKPGFQKVLFDGTVAQIDDIIQQISRYGAFAASEVLHVKDYVDSIYNIEEPVKQQLIERTIKHNEGVKIAKGVEFREQSVALFDRHMKTVAQKNHLPINRNLKVEVTEFPLRGGTIGIDRQSVEIVDDAEAPAPKRGRRAA